MKKFTLIAFPVEDITVGRYLAARGIDVLGVDLDQHTEMEIMHLVGQLKTWTSGPVIAGFSRDPEKLERYKSNGSLEALYHNNKDELNAQGIQFLDSNSKIPELKEGGNYIFFPGKEEETGLSNFDSMDAFLDSLEEI